MKKILVLGASRYYVRTIMRLKDYGYKVFVIDRNPTSPGFKVADGFEVIDITDSKKSYDYAKKLNIDGVMPLNDFGVPTAAYINEKMELPGIRPEVASIVIDKSRMREVWNKSGLPIPNYFVSDSLEDATKKLSMLRMPVIVKPCDSRGGGSRGVKAVFNLEEFEEAFNFAQSFYDNKNVIVEELVSGSEHSIEVFVKNGKAYILAISDKVKTPYPYRVDKEVIYPTILEDHKVKKLQEVIQRTIQSVGIVNGVSHIELSFTEQGPVLFEIGARPGGGATPEIVENVYGIEYIKLYAKIVTGESIEEDELQPKFTKSGIYHFFILGPSGKKVKKIKGIEEIKKIHYIRDFEIFINENDILKEVKTGNDRHGFAVIICDNRSEAIKIANLVDTLITVE